jgi:hypothetical protein
LVRGVGRVGDALTLHERGDVEADGDEVVVGLEPRDREEGVEDDLGALLSEHGLPGEVLGRGDRGVRERDERARALLEERADGRPVVAVGEGLQP